MRLFESTGALLFIGILSQHPGLEQAGNEAIRELESRGYKVFSSEPVKVYPATETKLEGGTWSPGVIGIRTKTSGTHSPEVFLRHELMHEAEHRYCKNALPIWAKEASAISFSGEANSTETPKIDKAALQGLRKSVRQDSELSPRDYETLKKLVSLHGWPQTPCQLSPQIAKVVEAQDSFQEMPFSYVLMSMVSGQVLESKGSLRQKAPPGSLMKIPYVAALKTAPAESSLNRSDTESLSKMYAQLDYSIFDFLYGTPSLSLRGAERRSNPPHLMGERSEIGDFAFETNLKELSLLLRSSLLTTPKRFLELERNGFEKDSTLYTQSENDKRTLSNLHALSKTGTISNKAGNPLLGHLMVVWPAKNPLFIAVFRKGGVRGSELLPYANSLLTEWKTKYPEEYGAVRVEILSLLSPEQFQIKFPCAAKQASYLGKPMDWTRCGEIEITTQAKGANPKRVVAGFIDASGVRPVLVTDAWTYAGSVIKAEADGLQGEARKALAAVIAWDAVHGRSRHQNSHSLCDSTHCMVFKGNSVRGSSGPETLDMNLLELLDTLASAKAEPWFSFSKGGTERWTRRFHFKELSQRLHESRIVSIKRFRNKSAEVMMHLEYGDGEETVPCEIFYKKLELPTCPDAVKKSDDIYIFEGLGAGHGLGLNIGLAQSQSLNGMSAHNILKNAYQ